MPYIWGMDVAVTELRAHLRDWLERVGAGEELVITDRGTPIARVIGVDSTAALERLTAEGVVSRPARVDRPTVSGRPRPRPRRPVADRVAEQRG